MKAVPAVDVVVVLLEFVALIAATWVTWFAVVIVHHTWSRRTKDRSGYVAPK
jgi:hypothetical protein